MTSAVRIAGLVLLLWPALGWAGPRAGQTDSLHERVQAGDPEALEIFEQRFRDSRDVEKKKNIAVFLASAGKASEEHVVLLEAHAWEAVRSARPYPFEPDLDLDAEGNPVGPRTFSPEFAAWVESVSGDLEQEARAAIWDQPGEIVRLGFVEDPRIDAVLMAGLHTPNHAVKLVSIRALVQHGHVEAVSEIFQAALGMPAQMRLGAGMSLLGLFDERADEAARELIGDDELYRELRDDLRARAAAPRQDDRGAEPSVNPNAPRLTAHPGSKITVAGQETRFTCAAEGIEPVSFSWERDGEPVVDGRRVSGAETATLTLYAVEPSDNGSYRCVARNEAGETISGRGILKVIAREGS